LPRLAARSELLALRGRAVTDPPIVVKTCRSDLQSYVQLQMDLVRFGHNRVLVCVPDPDLATFDRMVSADFALIGADGLLRGCGWPFRLRDDWSSQQLFKLLLVAASGHEACWVLDANTLLLEPLPDPWQEGQVVLAVGTPHPFDTRCFDSSARFLGVPPDGPSMDPVNQPLRGTVVRALLEWIEHRYFCRAVEALVSSIYAGRGRPTPLWTEYGLYRSFAFHVATSAHRYHEDSERVAYYNHARHGPQLQQWLGSLKRSRPKMVKVYARRPDYLMETRELDQLCDRIRACR
jgi:hypothetical protein